jgi:catechol 2,3-dioxygenase-like lactoylglutathione lyase family enzyme
MIDHIGIAFADLPGAKVFYHAALAPLGYEVLMEFAHEGKQFIGFGAGGKPDLWLEQGQTTAPRLHLAFHAKTRAIVDAFYRAALAAGGRDNGAPGLRPHYHPNYYGAFVLDPEGHNVEAVCHDPET